MRDRDRFPARPVSGARIVLIDDHELLRAGMISLISKNQDFTVVGDARDRAHALDIVRREQPDVILLNIDLKSGDGLEMIADLLSECETARLAALTDSKDHGVHRQAVLLGATGVISKQDPPDLLMKAIARIHEGGVWLDRSVTASMLREVTNRNRSRNVSPEERRIASLTEREREVVRLVGDGLKNKQIAKHLFISAVTVHHHLTSIYSKLELTNKLELLVYSYRNGLADPPCNKPS